jgi:ABC-type multidrug transport system ATPase subunit
MEFVIEGLTKTYRRGLKERLRGRDKSPRKALAGIDLQISTGTFGLLGPNGAGKTTLMRILATLLAPTSGRILVDGQDMRSCTPKVRQSVGYLPQDFRAYPNLKVNEFLDYSAVIHGMLSRSKRRRAVESVIESTGLTEVAGRRIKKLSGGMHRRVGVAQALLGPPKLLIVDEPTVGLDPEERIKLRSELARVGMNCTIILSTHIVGDISSSCERLAILDAGQIIFQGSPSELLSEAEGRIWELSVGHEEYDAIKAQHRIVRTIATTDGLNIRTVGDRPQRNGVTSATPSLEDAYVLIMGNRLGEDEASMNPRGPG